MRLLSECDCPASVVAWVPGCSLELIRTNIAYIEITFDRLGYYSSGATSSGITSQVALPLKGQSLLPELTLAQVILQPAHVLGARQPDLAALGGVHLRVVP